MLGFQFVLFAAAVASLGGLGHTVPVTQDCINCITTALTTHGDGWLRASLKRIDDDLSRRSDHQHLQLESGEEQDQFSRWLYKRQEVNRLREGGQLRDPSDDTTLRRIRRAPMKKKNSKEQKRGGPGKRPGKHSHEHHRHSHEHKHRPHSQERRPHPKPGKHSHEHKHKPHSHEHHRPRPKPGKHSKERTTSTMPETSTTSTTSTTTPSTTTPSTTTPSTTTPSTTTLSTTTPSTTTPSTTTSTTAATTTSSTTTPSTTIPSTTTPSTTISSSTSPSTTPSTTLSTTNPSTTTESTTTTTSTTTPATTTTSTATDSTTTSPTTVSTSSTPPRLRKRRSAFVLLPSSNQDIYSASSEYKKPNKPENKHHKPSKQSPGKHNKEYSNIKQFGNKRKSSNEEGLNVSSKSNIANSTLNQNNTSQSEFLKDYKNFTSFDRSSEEDDTGIATTSAFVNVPVTQMPDSDEVDSIEDLSTEDYRDIFTTESPSSIENDSQSAEDVDVTTEDPDDFGSKDSYDYYSDEDISTEAPDKFISSESHDYYSDEDNSTEVPDKFISNETYDYYSYEDTSKEDNIIVTTTPDALDSNESNSAEDHYQTTLHPKDNNSMESVETIGIPETVIESVPDSINTRLTAEQHKRINSNESIEVARNSSVHVNSKESGEDEED